MLELFVRLEAEQDVYDAFEWYEAQQVGLGSQFADAIDAAFEQIATHHLRTSVNPRGDVNIGSCFRCQRPL